MPKGFKNNVMTFEQKIKMGLIKSTKEQLNQHFNYYYLFEKVRDQESVQQKVNRNQ